MKVRSSGGSIEIHHRMMHDAVTKRRRGDNTGLAVIDREQTVISRLVIAVRQLSLECDWLAAPDRDRTPLRQGGLSSPPRFAVGQEEILETHQLRPNIAKTFHIFG